MRVYIVPMILLLAVGPALAKEKGVDSPRYFAPIGCGVGPDGGPDGCHDRSADANLAVQLDGVAAIPTGGSANYMVSLPVGADGKLGSGMNVAVGTDSTASCDLDSLGASNLKFIGGNLSRQATLTHANSAVQAPTGNLGAWSYAFALTNCTVPGTLHLLASMMAYDNDGDVLGDVWNTTEMNITVPEPTPDGVASVAIAALALLTRRRSPLRNRTAGMPASID